MILKQCSTKISPWAFKVTFDSENTFNDGYDDLKQILGYHTTVEGDYRWYCVQDIARNAELQKRGYGFRPYWRKGRIYVFDADIATYLRLLCI